MLESKSAVKRIIVIFHIREVPGSDLSPEAGYRGGFFVDFLNPPRQMPGQYRGLIHNCFLPQPYNVLVFMPSFDVLHAGRHAEVLTASSNEPQIKSMRLSTMSNALREVRIACAVNESIVYLFLAVRLRSSN